MFRDKDVQRFRKYMPEFKGDSCAPWTGGKNKRGYGAFNVFARRVDAHRFSYMAFRGPIPPGIFVCHKCDNPPCVRPDHLFLGTHSDNMKDAANKGRISPPRRIKNPNWVRPSRKIENPNTKPGAKITKEIAADIKVRLANNETGRSIARLYSLHFGSVSDIKRGLTWRDV